MLKTRQDFVEASSLYKSILDSQKKKILVCAGTGCVAAGSLKVFDRFQSIVEKYGLRCSLELKNEPHDENEVGLKHSGCLGFCEMGPLVRLEPGGILYTKVKPEDCEEIIETSLLNNGIVDRLVFKQDGVSYPKQEDIPFYSRQTRRVFEHCGRIDAESVKEYIALGGYQAVVKALFDMTPDEIISEVLKSGLRGRGGAGFPTGKKWQQVQRQREAVKYIVCNGDEGDPGAFMDEGVMEGDPNRILEGMIIAGIATGAHEGYIYVRAEYPLAVIRLRKALEQAEEMGLLGDDILGSGFSFKININRGAGAFVCGEGSALTASIEGKRGMPRVKPPRTVEHGLFDKPTILNNVETFANVPFIILNGGGAYRALGTENSPGTKIFALTGNVKHTGLIEVPMGTTLNEIIFNIGGGVKDGHGFKAVQIGGPSGGCLTKEHLEVPLDFDSLKKIGAMVGSGGLVVMDDRTCMVEVARFFMHFTQNESCGKCVPCREGTKRMLEVLENIVSGKASEEDLDILSSLADTISHTSLCGLGQTAPNPVVSTLKYFRDEYLAHVVEKKCPTNNCKKLVTYYIDKDLCKGCSKCARICPAGAISGELKSPYTIDPDKCIKCGSCIEACSFKAIREE